jgi:hypothetical protein
VELGAEGFEGVACEAEDCEVSAQVSGCDPPTSPLTTPTATTRQNLRPNRTTLYLMRLSLMRGAAPETWLNYFLKFAPIIETSSSARLRTNSS